ncbi:MAG: bifunctional aspartate kinase/homoserine dehydrogenase I [Chloroherpetonaceae bacterium]|nr:bifunctional aspartate kinase/homoserine dehydrogenase I [Chloroherpetonaceae bacterium]MCS7211699.1 bifunctional aspartate kinase/homoserine dehydrogenase I [Chloroherpetonaceae bacterium]
MKVLKFGGTSVGTPQSIEQVIQLSLEARKHSKIAVVVSAFSGVTDELLSLTHLAAEGDEQYRTKLQQLESRHLDAVKALIHVQRQSSILAGVKKMLNELEEVLNGVFLIKEYTPRTMDFILSFGERLSAYIVTEAFKEQGVDAEYLDARLVVKTDDNFGAARVDAETTYQNIRSYFGLRPALQVITGFIGSTPQGQTTTLGRGGSDYTAALFAAALGATEIQIWTDVNGFMTADPRKVPDAFPIPQMTYNEALEMSNSGAKVLYAPTIQPAMSAGIPIRILNTFNPAFEGTLICSELPNRPFPVCGISSLDDVALLRVEGTGLVRALGSAKRLFGALADAKVNVIFISQASSEHSICVAVAPKDAKAAKAAIQKEFALEIAAGKLHDVEVETDLSIIAAVGENMRRRTGIAGWFFQTLGKNGINIVAIAQGSSELNISVVIDKRDESKALNALHEAFFLSEKKTLNVFLVGTGLIGGTLLRQINAHRETLRKEKSLEIRVIALARRSQMVFNERGINLNCWQETLRTQGEPTNLKKFVAKMKELNLPNSIFIDCTASDEVIEHYAEILSSSISIVTPNKRANSGPFESYRTLKLLAIKNDVKFLYETNVGAGLPVINTLQDLLNSGDKILKIEAVLSGSLSYIFNNFTGSRLFSEVVREAKEKGYTEPDPREDLSGMDVARKALILAREIGWPLELHHVEVENFLPQACLDAPSVEDFFKELERANPIFEARKQHAAAQHKKLCFVACLENGRASVRLQEVDSSHPFYTLSGSDNIISYTTERYYDRPLVVKGPGAGAEVTAAGVFANIVWISNYLS